MRKPLHHKAPPILPRKIDRSKGHFVPRAIQKEVPNLDGNYLAIASVRPRPITGHRANERQKGQQEKYRACLELFSTSQGFHRFLLSFGSIQNPKSQYKA